MEDNTPQQDNPVSPETVPAPDSSTSTDVKPPESPSPASEPSNEHNSPLPIDAKNEQPKQKKPTLVIALAVLIAAVLIGLAAYMYLKNNNTTTTSNTTPVTQATPATPATSQDVTDATSSLDEAIAKADQANDVSSADLTDSSLGL